MLVTIFLPLLWVNGELVAQVIYFDQSASFEIRNHLIGHGNSTKVSTQPVDSDPR